MKYFQRFLISYFIVLLLVFLIFLSNYLKDEKQSSDEKYFSVSLNKICNPIKPNYKNSNQFQIDNQTYPKSILLHKNKSIDFDCLNKNKNTKIILLWTKYYNKKDHAYGLGFKKPFENHGKYIIYIYNIIIDS
jgi:hypothetical protein